MNRSVDHLKLRHLRLVPSERDPTVDPWAQSKEEAIYGIWFVPTITQEELRNVHSEIIELMMRQRGGSQS